MIGITSLISLFGGSISGIIGHWIKGKEEDRKLKSEIELLKVKGENEIALRKLDMDRDRLNSELAIAELDKGIQLEESKLNGQLEVTEAEGFNAAVVKATKDKLGSKTLQIMLNGNGFMRFLGGFIAFLLGITDVIRGLIRPTLTAFAFGTIVYIGIDLLPIIESMTQTQQYGLTMLIIDAVIYVVTASTQFWFMDRSGARKFREKHSKTL